MQTYLVNSHKSLDKMGAKPQPFFSFCRKVQQIVASSLSWDWSGQGWLLCDSTVQLHLPARPWGGHTELSSSSAGAVPAVSPPWLSQPWGGCVHQKLLTITPDRRCKLMPLKAPLRTSTVKLLWTIQGFSFKEEAVHTHTYCLQHTSP